MGQEARNPLAHLRKLKPTSVRRLRGRDVEADRVEDVSHDTDRDSGGQAGPVKRKSCRGDCRGPPPEIDAGISAENLNRNLMTSHGVRIRRHRIVNPESGSNYRRAVSCCTRDLLNVNEFLLVWHGLLLWLG
jgi:hypothetical protein